MKAQVKPDFVQYGDQVEFEDGVYFVKSTESDNGSAWDFYLSNNNGSAHKIVTDSVTLIW